MTRKLLVAAVLSFAALTGCNSVAYTTPGGRADFAKLGLSESEAKAMTDPSIRETLSKRPMVTFPTAVAVVRVQGADYGNGYHNRTPAYGRGAFSVVTVRDVEKEEDFTKIAQLPKLQGVAPLKQILLSRDLQSDLDLRNAAAKLHAGMLLYYTFDTQFYTDEKVAPLSLITLGIFPNRQAHVTTTASAVLMDVNNGYIYGVYESTSKQQQLANAWTSQEAVDDVRRKAEREAFAGLVDQFSKGWVNVVVEYGGKERAQNK